MLADRPGWILIENEGALFRGLSRSFPCEVRDGSHWKPYTGNVPKPIEWGYPITEEDARRDFCSDSSENAAAPE